MAEYVEKNKIREAILDWAVCLNNPNILSRSDALFLIDHVENDDVAPVRYARWRLKETVHFGLEQYMCSACQEDEYWEKYYCRGDESFCPNCGAKMDSEQEEPANEKRHDT